MITLDEISVEVGGKLLFENVSMAFQPGNRYGLTGPNGAGKSTLLGVIMGRREPTTGHVTLPRKVGILRQNIADFEGYGVIETVVMGNERLSKALHERDILYEKEMTDEIGMRLGELEEIIAEEDGYSADTEAETLLAGMGVPEEYYTLKMGEIPTDMQFRALLCQSLFGNPEALLLDEPTNHLDLESIGWLENFLHSYTGTLIVISHDRHFLNAVTTHIADIDYQTIILYPGNYDDMREAKTSVRDQEEKDAKSKEKKIAQLREFVAKFGAGTRASQVQSRIREIDKLQPPELKKSNIQRPYIRFIPTEKEPGKIVLKAENLVKGYDNSIVIDRFSLEVARGDKIAVIGNNGRGKSTLLKMLSGALQPEKGTVEPGFQVKLGYFPQNHEDVIDKKSKETAFEWLQKQKSGVYEQEIRSVLGKMLFGGDDAFKPLYALSGGETARLLLAKLILVDNNLLILDEPNNHLDLESVSALAWGLNEYKGTAVFATHDRDLIEQVATKIISFEEKGIRIFNGTYAEYKAK